MVLFENLSEDSNTCKVKVYIKLDFFLPKFYSLLKKKWVEMQKHYDRGDTRAYPSCNLNDDDAKLEEVKTRHFA